jgi:hypothetical protein
MLDFVDVSFWYICVFVVKVCFLSMSLVLINISLKRGS